MTSRGWTILGAAGLAAGVACHRPGPPAGIGGGEAEDAGGAAAAALPAFVAARCRAMPWSASLPGDGGDPDLDLGDALPLADGVAIALVHREGGDRVAAVAFVRPDRDAVARVVDLGPTLGDAPPPLLAASAPAGTEILAAYHAVPPRGAARPADDHGATRPLVVRSVTPDASTPLFSIDEQRDDSLAADLAVAGDHGLVVWDEATSEPRGVIRGAVFATRQGVGPVLDLSPRDSDAESPRVVPFGAGYAVVWIARGPDAPAAVPEASDLEALGEPRTRGWLEMVTVDGRGAPTGPVRRLTPPAGHVTAFDLRSPSRAGSPPRAETSTLLVAVRDDGEEVDGSGGTLLRVRVGRDTVEPPVAFTTEGLGRGAPAFVEGAATWLTWVGPGEQLRMMGLDSAGTPSGLPSAEEAMMEARPVLALPGGRVLVETPGDGPRPLRTFTCGP